MQRISPRTWSRLTPGLPLPLATFTYLVAPMMGTGFWQSFIACMIAGTLFVAIALWIGPRQPLPFVGAESLRAHLGWGIAFIAGGAVVWNLRADELRYGGAGFLCLGLIYVVVGVIAMRWYRKPGRT